MEGNAISKKVTAIEELQEIFRQAQQEGTPVSLYRDNQADGIALDLSEWNEMEVFDLDNLMVIVPPGILLKDIQAVALDKGIRFIPAETPAYASMSVGEWAYRGCPNPGSLKFGAGKHFLLGASYVLPSGDLIKVGGMCIKNVTGYDLTRFLSGPYADLAVGVRYVIKLMPQPIARKRFEYRVESTEKAAELVKVLNGRSVPPAWLYWFDSAVGSKLFGTEQTGERVMFELDGNQAELEREQTEIGERLAGIGQQADVIAELPDMSFLENETDAFWLMDEFKVRPGKVAEFAAKFAQLRAEYGVGGGLFGQLADGKIHLYLQARSEATEKIITALQTAARELNGAFTGKYQRLYGTVADNPMAALEEAMKKQLDPKLIFNRRG